MKQLLVFLIRVYQWSFSPDHSWRKFYYPNGFCPFYPSCSEYSKIAIERHGAIKGSWLAAKRIWTCRPGREPHVDLVPEIN